MNLDTFRYKSLQIINILCGFNFCDSDTVLSGLLLSDLQLKRLKQGKEIPMFQGDANVILNNQTKRRLEHKTNTDDIFPVTAKLSDTEKPYTKKVYLRTWEGGFSHWLSDPQIEGDTGPKQPTEQMAQYAAILVNQATKLKAG